MQIRRAGPQDAEAIVEVVNAAWRWAYAHIIPPEQLATLERPGRTERIRKSLCKEQITFVSEIERRVVGFASIEEPCRLPQADFEIGGLYVHPDLARKGIGRALLRRSVEEALEWNRTRLAIHTLRDNHIGRAFYDRCGGKVVQDDTWTFREIEYPTVWYVFADMPSLVLQLAERVHD